MSVTSLTTSLLALFLIPVDVYSVSHGDTIGISQNVISIIYYGASLLTELLLSTPVNTTEAIRVEW